MQQWICQYVVKCQRLESVAGYKLQVKNKRLNTGHASETWYDKYRDVFNAFYIFLFSEPSL